MQRFPIVIILITYCVGSKCEDVFFVARKLHPEEYFCVTNSTNALAWILDGEAALNHTGHAAIFNHQIILFGPSSLKRRVFGAENLNKDDTVEFSHRSKRNLRLDHSCIGISVLVGQTGNRVALSDEIILDRRWEDLPTFTSGPLTPVLNISTPTNFTIPLSIRISTDAHIFLCDGTNITSSNCYWFLLQSHDGRVTALRKCPKGTIPDDQAEEHNCEEMDYHYKNLHPFLSNSSWNHFLLSKTNDELTFHRVGEPGVELILGLRDERGYAPTRMFIESRKGAGLWKIHQVRYTEISAPSTDLLPITVQNGTACVSMFVQTCPRCEISLEYLFQNKSLETLTLSTSKWRQIEFRATGLQADRVDLQLAPSGGGKAQFWAYSNLGACPESGFRKLSLTYNAPCQLMSGFDNIIQGDEDVPSVDGEGRTVPTFPGRGPLKIYQSYGKLTKYTCSPGYKGRDCDIICDKGFYGNGCLSQCDKCNGGECNSIDGVCSKSGCLDSYSGPKCDMAPPPSLLWLLLLLLVVPVGAAVVFIRRSRARYNSVRKDDVGA